MSSLIAGALGGLVPSPKELSETIMELPKVLLTVGAGVLAFVLAIALQHNLEHLALDTRPNREVSVGTMRLPFGLVRLSDRQVLDPYKEAHEVPLSPPILTTLLGMVQNLFAQTDGSSDIVNPALLMGLSFLGGGSLFSMFMPASAQMAPMALDWLSGLIGAKGTPKAPYERPEDVPEQESYIVPHEGVEGIELPPSFLIDQNNAIIDTFFVKKAFPYNLDKSAFLASLKSMLIPDVWSSFVTENKNYAWNRYQTYKPPTPLEDYQRGRGLR